MHRSGTSAITRGLQVLGVSLGDHVLPPQGDNQKGFWEDIDLNALNMETLSALGSDWHHLAPIESGDVDVLSKKGYIVSGVDLLRRKVGKTPVFGFKDPRVVKLLPFWKVVFNNCHLDVSYVLALRHPLSVASSLARRNGFDAEKSYLLWLEYVITSLSSTFGEKRILIDYDLLMNSPEHELKRIAKCLDLEINPAELQHYLSEFLDAGLRHTVYDLNELSSDDTCPPLVREIYTTLLDVASDNTNITDVAIQNKVEQWVGEFERSKSYLTLVDKIYIEKEAVAQTVSERDEKIVNIHQTLVERDNEIENIKQAVACRDIQILNLKTAINAYNNSTSWRITMPVRAAGKMLRKIVSVVKLNDRS